MPLRELRLGIDLGYVVTNGSMEDMYRELQRGRKDFRAIPHVPGVFRGLRQLVEQWFGHRVWIISACERDLEQKLLEWLFANAFFSRTGLQFEQAEFVQHVWFCREYESKAPIANALRLTHMVDDRPEVLIPMQRIVRYRFLFNPDPQVLEKFRAELGDIIVVHTWRELVIAVGATMEERHRRARRRNTRPQKVLHPSR